MSVPLKRLETVQDRFKGLRYEDLKDEDRRRIDDAIIHATIVRQDEPTEDQESVYLIFERLNTGGSSLHPQEIRAALYNGPLARLLRALNDNDDWRAVFGKRSERFKDHELILRFFALLFYAPKYEREQLSNVVDELARRHQAATLSSVVVGCL